MEVRKRGSGRRPARDHRTPLRPGSRDRVVLTQTRDIQKYYLRISADEISSYLAPVSFDLWQSVDRYRHTFHLKDTWLDVGGGVGEIAAVALKHGYDVHMTEVLGQLLTSTAQRHPELANRLSVLDIFDGRAVRLLGETRGHSAIITALGAVLNHAPDIATVARGFSNLLALSSSSALLVVDIMLSEMFPGSPASIWADFLHVLPNLSDIHRLIARHRLRILEAHSINYLYPAERPNEADFDERMMRFFLLRAA